MSLRKSRGLGALMATSALVVAACSSASSPSTTGSTVAGAGATAPAVVNIGYVADMQVPDPDIFYELEGNSVMTSVYEGLLQYANNTNQVVPSLAESYTVTPDGLTYTFRLRANVLFHDGTTMTSSDAQASFERRTALGPVSAPGYMLADVVSYATPDPLTFVVQLKQPVSPFLDYLAAPYGPKVLSKKALADHAGTDIDQAYLKAHDAGTGPFTISEFVPADHYTLTSVPGYWGGAPAVTKVHIAILPDLSTQQLKLQSGELQMILHGLSKSDIASYEKNPKFQVQRFPANLKAMIMVNQNKGVFKDLALRRALQQAIDKQQIVNQVYGADASVSTQIYPTGVMATGLAADTPKLDPSVLAAAVKGLADKKVDLAYVSDDARNQRVAELIQTELQSAGFSATTRPLPIAVAFDLPNHADQAPDLVLTTINPDAAQPDTWIRIFMNTKGALNWLQCSVPASDAEMDLGQHSTTAADVESHYAKAGDLMVANACFDTIADVKDVVVAAAGYSNWAHQLPTIFSVKLGQLKLHS